MSVYIYIYKSVNDPKSKMTKCTKPHSQKLGNDNDP